MAQYDNLGGTTEEAFQIGQSTLDASNLTAARSLELQNRSGLAGFDFYQLSASSDPTDPTFNALYLLTASSSWTFTLPTIATFGVRGQLRFKVNNVTGSSAVTIAGSGGDTIDGLSSVTMYFAGDFLEITATAGGWIISIEGRFGELVSPGTVIDYAGSGTPRGGYLKCDGTAVNRTTYSRLYKEVVPTQSCSTTNSSTTVTVADSSIMFVGMKVEGTGIPAGATVATVVNGTTITISVAATATGSPTLLFFLWGNGNGSSTFNLPDFRRRTAVGSGGTGTAALGSAVGQTGGSETHTLSTSEMPSHTHSTGQTLNAAAGSIAWAGGPFSIQTTSGSTGSGTAHNNIQPSAVVGKWIKY